MPSAAFTVDATIASRRFTLNAFLVGSRVRHDRTLDHTGVEDATTVVLASAIGQYPAGTTVQAVLASMVARFTAIESSNHHYAYATLDAFILPHFWLNAVKKRTISSSYVLDAVVSRAQTFTLNAALRTATSGGTRTFTLAAFVV